MKDAFPLRGWRNRVWFRLPAGAAVGLGLAACGSAANMPEPETDRGLLSREVAIVLAHSQQVDQELASSIQRLGTPFGSSPVVDSEALPGLEPPSLEGCMLALSGADLDQDGYPGERETLAIDCEVPFSHLKGTVVLEDKDDMDAASGFISNLDFTMALAFEGETIPLGDVESAIDVTATAGGAGYELAYRSLISFLVPDGSGLPALESALAYTGTLGGSFESGTMAIAGTYSFVFHPVDRSADMGSGLSSGPLTVSSTAIEFDGANCDSTLTGGSFSVHDGRGNALRISYDGCGERTAAYNGEPLPAPVPEG